MKIQIGLLTLALLVGCAKESASGQGADDKVATPPSAITAETSEAVGMGEVTSVNADAGTITISHGPIEALKWPAMTMAFKATPDQLASVKPGDSVHFKFEQAGGGARLMSVSATK